MDSKEQTEEKAYACLKDAEKKKNYKGWFGRNKLDEAAEQFQNAGNYFKCIKKWKEAGDAYYQAAGCLILIQENDEATTSYINASKCYKKSSPMEAVNSLKQAIQFLIEKGKLNQAANHQKTIAEIYETDLMDVEKALEAYETAADWYSTENLPVLSNQCSLKVAHLSGELEQYEKAYNIFEKVATNSIDNELAKWSVKEYLLKAGLCHLANKKNETGFMNFLETFEEIDGTFRETREYKFLENVLNFSEEKNIDEFVKCISEYDSLTRLDPWKTKILLKIKKGIEEIDIL